MSSIGAHIGAPCMRQCTEPRNLLPRTCIERTCRHHFTFPSYTVGFSSLSLSKTPPVCSQPRRVLQGFVTPAQGPQVRTTGRHRATNGDFQQTEGKSYGRDEFEKESATLLESSKKYPVTRTYRNDLTSLRVTGEALPWQVIAAMGADGGGTAAQELARGKYVMAIETFIPGRASDNSSIATKLRAPTQKIVERAKTLFTRQDRERASISSRRAFAIAFQAVIIQKLTKFQLSFYKAGSLRDLSNFSQEQKADILTSLEVLVDESELLSIAQAVSTYALASVKENLDQKLVEDGLWTRLSQHWRTKIPMSTKNKHVHIRSLSEQEILAHSERLQEEATTLGEEFRESGTEIRPHHSWWHKKFPAMLLSQRCWTVQLMNEYMPAHKLEYRGKNGEDFFAIYLTHSQMVDLADVLDLYYEDQYTCPGKDLHTNLEMKFSQRSWSKATQAVWVGALASVLGGALLLGLLVSTKLRGLSSTSACDSESPVVSLTSTSELPFLDKWRETLRNQEGIQPVICQSFVKSQVRILTRCVDVCSSGLRQPIMPMNDKISKREMDVLCGLLVAMVKDAFSWPFEIKTEAGEGAWIGTDLAQLEKFSAGQNSESSKALQYELNDEEMVDYKEDTDVDEGLVPENDELDTEVGGRSTGALEASTSTETLDSAPQDIIVFQVVMSRDGKVLGFQPGSANAITKWASFPYASMLHQRQSYGSAGLFERGMKYTERPNECVVLELLVRDDSSAPAAFARPFHVWL